MPHLNRSPNCNAMSKLVVAICSFIVAAVSMPVTYVITQPMIRRIAMSGPGEPDLSIPRAMNKCGLGLGIIAFLIAIVFASQAIAKLPSSHGSLAAFLTALAIAGIPAVYVFSGGPANAAGDGGPNFVPLFILIGGGIIALPFLIWSLILLWPDRT